MGWISRWFGKKKKVDPMKYLIVGLGNMGEEYDDTRHNIGFDIIDTLVKKYDGKVKHERFGDVSKIKYRGRTIHLLKPSTFMNRSGRAVHYWMDKLNIAEENLLIVVDDINIEFGIIRLRSKGSHGGHNGLTNIQNFIGDKYARLRFGIGNDFNKGRQVDHVLGNWTEEELEMKDDLIKRSIQAILDFSFRGVRDVTIKQVD